MPDFTTTTFNSGNPPGIDAAFMNAFQAQIQHIYSVYILTTPYLFANNDSVTVGTPKQYTIVGHGTPTIPSGAKAALVSAYWSNASNGGYLQMTPHGATISNPSYYPLLAIYSSGAGLAAGNAVVPLDSNGILDAIAGNSNVGGLYASVYGYVY